MSSPDPDVADKGAPMSRRAVTYPGMICMHVLAGLMARMGLSRRGTTHLKLPCPGCWATPRLHWAECSGVGSGLAAHTAASRCACVASFAAATFVLCMRWVGWFTGADSGLALRTAAARCLCRLLWRQVLARLLWLDPHVRMHPSWCGSRMRPMAWPASGSLASARHSPLAYLQLKHSWPCRALLCGLQGRQTP